MLLCTLFTLPEKTEASSREDGSLFPTSQRSALKAEAVWCSVVGLLCKTISLASNN